MTPDEHALQLASRAQSASAAIARASTKQKNCVLLRVADALLGPQATTVRDENTKDLADARATGLLPALVNRLELDLKDLSRAVREVAALPDPVGAIHELTTRPSGIQVGRMRVPLGVVLIVYESRPNVTVDAAALCLKAGNAVILRGGKEALHTNRALADVVRNALVAEGLPSDATIFVEDPAHAILHALVQQSAHIDLVIPRGGTQLIDVVNQYAKVPVIQHYQGICHVYVHGSADLDVAERVIVNAKVQRPGVCNAAECLIVDASVAVAFLPRAIASLREQGVEIRGDEHTRAIVGDVKPVTQQDYDTEFLALILAIRVVDGFDDALAFLRRHGSRHTETIIAKDHDAAMRFLREVDASCVLVNASTRFNDGGELGLGAELGISTTKLHAYGPMGVEELCARKFVVLGHGETR